MQTQIRWNTKELTKDLPEDESGFYKAIGELLPEIETDFTYPVTWEMLNFS